MDKIQQAAQLKAQGKSYSQIAESLSVSKSTIHNWLKKVNKGWPNNPTWNTVRGGEERPVDAFGAIPAPSCADLLNACTDTVFACVNWVSNKVAATRLKVYVTTAQGQNPPRNSVTVDVPHKTLEKLRFNPNIDIREVVSHPLVKLLERPNEEMSKFDVLKFTDESLSLAGVSYWHIEREEKLLTHDILEEDGLPIALWPMQSQYVEPIRDKGKIVAYKYNIQYPGIVYPAKDVICFRLMNPINPYMEGYSPVRAVYERILLAKYELAYLSSLYRNQARPDSLVLVKNGITAAETESYQTQINQKFRQGGIGGTMVVDADEIDVKNLNWQPKDILGTELYKYQKLQIINSFALNPSIFDTESSNRAVQDAARYQAETDCIQPRLRVIEEKLNHRLIPEFDTRFFVQFEENVIEDQELVLKQREMTLKERIEYLTANVVQGNEVRHDLELPPLPESESKDDNELRATVGGCQAILSLQSAVYSGQVPREAGIANAMSVFGFTTQEAQALFPQVKPVATTDATAPSPVRAEVSMDEQGHKESNLPL